VLGAIALLAVSSIVLAGGVFAVTERDQSQLDFGASQVDKLHAIATPTRFRPCGRNRTTNP
jgi:hypothetical protein